MSKRLTFEEKQSRLDNLYRLKFQAGIEITSLGDVLFYLFLNKNPYCTERLYKNNKDFAKQLTGSARSIEDTYIIAKEYLPNITYETVYKAVESMYTSHYYLSHWFCYTVNRRVHGQGYGDKKGINQYLNKLQLNVYLEKTEAYV